MAGAVFTATSVRDRRRGAGRAFHCRRRKRDCGEQQPAAARWLALAVALGERGRHGLGASIVERLGSGLVERVAGIGPK